MKIKRQPEDFEVEELTSLAATGGPFALYRLTKRSIGTPEVVQAMVQRWAIDRRRISYGGLKDRHALTRQYVTIERGPRQALKQSEFQLEYLGQAPRPFTPRDISGNRFRIVLRDLAPRAAAEARDAIGEIDRAGLPNYFDDQRFGSLGESGEFIAPAWCLGDYERALRLAIAEPNEHDRPDDREQKRLLREGWGKWAELKGRLDRSSRRSLVTYLADHPTDFRGALARVNEDLRSLFLSSFQSHLWNQVLSSVVEELLPAGRRVRVELKSGDVWFPREAAEGLQSLLIPLPSARAQIADPAMKRRIEEVARKAGLELSAMKIRHPKGNFFSKGERPALFRPAGLAQGEAADDLYPGRRKIHLAFDLPRGCYATILVKRLQAPAR